MLRRLQAFFVFGVTAVSIPAAAADTGSEDKSASGSPQPASGAAASPSTAPDAQSAGGPRATTDSKPSGFTEGWRTEIHGYFRAPMAISASWRPNPDTPNGPNNLQLSYAPNRTLDWSYYSFAYTRLQEQDWAELTFHEKKKHVDAEVGWMGYWLAGAGFRNPDAAAVPGIAALTLDTDVTLGDLRPNIALKAGSWWPQFGYFEKYDTFTLGRFRQMGEQLKVTLPVNPDLTVTAVQGFGTGRDGTYNYNVASTSPLYASQVGTDLLVYFNLRLQYKKYLDLGLHFNNEWTIDPYLKGDGAANSGKSYSDVANAHLTVVGGEANLSAPRAGRLWISPSVITVRNGWALGAGTEVMHSLGGAGIATNYMGYFNAPKDSTGTGSMFNLGFLYENTLSGVLGMEPGTQLPDVKLNIFGLMSRSSLDLPSTTTYSQNSFHQLKWGADVTLQACEWLSAMLRFDEVNYDQDHGGYVFAAFTPRITVSSHFLSSESIYFQYTRYKYGDHMLLGEKWPSGAPMVAGTDVTVTTNDVGKTPDEDVFKVQASVAF